MSDSSSIFVSRRVAAVWGGFRANAVWLGGACAIAPDAITVRALSWEHIHPKADLVELRYAMEWRVSRSSNPQGWQRVAGGRSAAETSGSGVFEFQHPEGMPEVCDPSGGRMEISECEPGVSLPPSLKLRRTSRSTPGDYQASLLRLAPQSTRTRTRRLTGRRASIWGRIMLALSARQREPLGVGYVERSR
jgi:hypothetical protein